MIRKSRQVKYLIQKSHLDTRTTTTCRSRYNKRWEAGTLKPVGHDLPYKQPPLHWNCRSIIKPLLSDGLKEEDSYSFEDWLDGMPPSVQDKVLGKGKAAIWRKAKAKGTPLTLNDLLDGKGQELSLQQLIRRYPEISADVLKDAPLTEQARQVKLTSGESKEAVEQWLSRDYYRQVAGELKNPRIKKIMKRYGLTQEEGVALRHYTRTGYYELNAYLRSGKGDNPVLEKVAETMRSGLNKLPDYRGSVVRRTKLPVHVLNQHVIGGVVKYDEFTSATFGKDVFAEYPHRLGIDAKHAKKIDWISYYGKLEEEVLFVSPTEFEVTGKRQINGEWHIELEEV